MQDHVIWDTAVYVLQGGHLRTLSINEYTSSASDIITRSKIAALSIQQVARSDEHYIPRSDEEPFGACASYPTAATEKGAKTSAR
jgi:hypothetical protein